MTHIVLATEDALSEAVAEKLLTVSGKPFLITQRLGNSGFGYLKKSLPKFNQIATNIMPVLLLTDLDRTDCILDFIQEWKQGEDLSERLLFRVVVREIEAWLLADRLALAEWLGINPATLPKEPESLVDPKRELLNLTKRSKYRKLKDMVLPANKSPNTVGLGYNTELVRYVREKWNPLVAAESAPSLARTLKRIQELAE